MKKSDQMLLDQLEGYNSFDSLDPVTGRAESKGVNAAVAGVAGNPLFKSQFNLRMTNVYYDVTAAAVILAAALPAALQVDNPVYIFGNADREGAYQKAKQLIPFVNGGAGFWNFVEFGIVGRDTFATSSTHFPTAVDGDMVFISSGVVAANTYERIAIVHCPQVAYGNLLASLSSDRFIANMIRYTVDATLTAQLSQQIRILRQSLFGKTTDDNIDPQTYIGQSAFNSNISDIPVELGVDKNTILGTQVLYNVTLIDWTITVYTSKKLQAVL